MGENLAMNIESRGFAVAVYDRSAERVREFTGGRALGRRIAGADSVRGFAESLKRPRKVMLMVKAGKPVDDLIEQVAPLLERGDIIIDGGNSHFSDTMRRTAYAESLGLLYVGAGISGGEEGALKGPSIMPGGSERAWEYIKPIFQSIAAQEDGNPCCEWIGENGAGHFVKMVHNAIEYGDMQLICEAYHLLKECLKMTSDELREVFLKWNEGELKSYLIQITANILGYKDTDGQPLVGRILDTAGQKGTGKWALAESLHLGVPLTLGGEAVYSRFLAAMKEERVHASGLLAGPEPKCPADREGFIEDIRNALYASKILSYSQGFSLLKAAAGAYGWDLDPGGIALMWRGGCIIRSAFLKKIKDAFDKEPELDNLLTDKYFRNVLGKAQGGWRRIVAAAAINGIPVPAIGSALSYYDGFRCKDLPANLLQAQRDYFGAHTYERIDFPKGQFFHTNWTGEGGDTSSSAYDV